MAKITGARQHSNRLKRMVQKTPSLVGAALYAAGQLIEIEAEHSITAGSVSGKGHVPSAPGEPPNADTRQLDTSIHTLKVSDARTEVEAIAPYAAAQEFGTKDGKLPERPFMRPAVKKKRAAAVELVRRAASKAQR